MTVTRVRTNVTCGTPTLIFILGIRSCYDEGKRVAETFCFDYWRTERVDVRVGRIFNTYGPGKY